MTKNQTYNRGFTLIETFVAVLILIFAVIAPMGLLARAISDGNFAKNQVTAYFLAQEGVELVINKRDQNVARSEDELPDPATWLNGLDACQSGGCNPDPNGSIRICRDIEDTGDFGGCDLYIVDEDSQSSYTTETSGNSRSIFKRQVKIEETSGGEKAKVTATVFWQERDRLNHLDISTVILNPDFIPNSEGGEGGWNEV